MTPMKLIYFSIIALIVTVDYNVAYGQETPTFSYTINDGDVIDATYSDSILIGYTQSPTDSIINHLDLLTINSIFNDNTVFLVIDDNVSINAQPIPCSDCPQYIIYDTLAPTPILSIPNDQSQNTMITTDSTNIIYWVYLYNDVINGDYYFRYIQFVFTQHQTGLSIEVNSVNIIDMSVYPNPVVDYVDVEFVNNSSVTDNIVLMTSNGQILKSIEAYDGYNKVSLDMTIYPSGMYMIRVGNEYSRIIK